MKKLIVFALLASLAAGMVVAQDAEGISLGVWGRTAFVPLEVRIYNDDPEHDNDTDLTSTMGLSWGGAHGRPAGLSFSGYSEYAGFDLDIFTDGGVFGLGDFASIWVKPLDWMKLTLGKFNEDTLRGKVDDNDFHAFVMNMSDADAIFTRFGGNDEFQAMLTLTPIDGLFIGFQLKELYRTTGNAVQYAGGTAAHAGLVWETIQIGAGYEIEGIGHARAQYIGAPKFTNQVDWFGGPGAVMGAPDGFLDVADYKSIEIAFALTMIEDMTLDIGVKIPLEMKYEEFLGTEDLIVNMPVLIGLGFDMGFGDIGINAKLDLGFGGGVEAKDLFERKFPFMLNFHLVPSYDLGFATVGLELGFDLAGKTQEAIGPGADLEDIDNSDYFDFGFGAWIKKDLGFGSIKCGLSYTIIDKKHYYDGASDDSMKAVNTGIFRIPIVAEISF